MVILYNKSLIMWKSKMQKTTALSTAEAENYSGSADECEALYLRALLHRLGFAQKKPTLTYEDNTVCNEWGNNVLGGCERAKHIDICFADSLQAKARARHQLDSGPSESR